uniref:Large ribosomal subunit protein bL28m n=1 Tax=Eucampia antarctica TaxID=49252 RepID=A0A7S2R1Y2_9STRA|mmetsp:Transcript_13555/g.13139  ORF Transcript_13555/g.13139 Transcript_13555/m.13139 type:complete len:183 (+) Transcript_13555:47-595(+)
MSPSLLSSLRQTSLSPSLMTCSRYSSLNQMSIPKTFLNILNSGTSVVDVTANHNQQVRHRSNRSRRGLYNGKDIRSGNNVSFSMNKTKRSFKPNVFKKSAYSEILDEMIRFHLTASTLRSIDKAGGLDNYLLTNKYVTEGEGLKAKKRIMNRLNFLEKKNGVGNALEKIALDRSGIPDEAQM